MAGCVDININITCTCVGKGMNRAPSTMRDTNQRREENRDNPWYGFSRPIEPTKPAWVLFQLKAMQCCNQEWCCKVVR